MRGEKYGVMKNTCVRTCLPAVKRNSRLIDSMTTTSTSTSTPSTIRRSLRFSVFASRCNIWYVLKLSYDPEEARCPFSTLLREVINKIRTLYGKSPRYGQRRRNISVAPLKLLAAVTPVVRMQVTHIRNDLPAFRAGLEQGAVAAPRVMQECGSWHRARQACEGRTQLAKTREQELVF